jgi:hypothetical protein
MNMAVDESWDQGLAGDIQFLDGNTGKGSCPRREHGRDPFACHHHILNAQRLGRKDIAPP